MTLPCVIIMILTLKDLKTQARISYSPSLKLSEFCVMYAVIVPSKGFLDQVSKIRCLVVALICLVMCCDTVIIISQRILT